MGALSKKLRSVVYERRVPRRTGFAHWCPGCKVAHVVWTVNPGSRPEWQWDNNVDAPTVSPSIRIFTPASANQPEVTDCHYFLREGNIVFCADSAHELAGKTVPLPDFPADYGGFDD